VDHLRGLLVQFPNGDRLHAAIHCHTHRAMTTVHSRARTGERGCANQYATGGLDHPLFVSRYLVALPKPEQLEQLIETDRAAWEPHHPDPSPAEEQP